MKQIFLTTILALLIFTGYAQVGINTTNPDSSAALHINGNGKGLLIPVMDKDGRERLKTSSPAKGLLAYDEEQKMFYFFNGTEWIALNPLQANDGNTDTLKLADGTSTITLENNTVVSGTLTVNDNTVVSSTLTVNDNTVISGTLTVNDNTILQNPVVINNTLTTNGDITSNGNIISNGNINAGVINTKKMIVSDTINTKTINAIDGFGITPIGGIIMWSGKIVPDGWALCDGNTNNGFTTPDLRGRFVVGYGQNGTGVLPNVWDYYTNPGDLSQKGTNNGMTGGEMKHVLTITEMPRHDHGINLRKPSGNGSGDRDFISGTQSHAVPELRSGVGYIEMTGGNSAHENRPPYYVLAFIMRVK